MTKWQEVKLGDVCEKVYSGGTPKSSNMAYYGGSIPWLNTKEVHFNRIYKTEKYITESGFNNSSAKWVPANSVIVAMYGVTAGNVAINLIPLTTNQACCNLLINKGIGNYKFIFYYLLYKNIELSSLANGGAQQNLNAQQIKDFPITLPPLEIQKKIAGVLGALDDKIELNNKINQNLELQAQALFKSWFVDFKPFGGTIPTDWKLYKLGEFLPVITGKKNANVSSSKGKYPFFSCSQDISWTDDYSFEGNAILVAGNGDFNVKFYNGKFEAYQRTYVLIPQNSRYADWLYYAVKHNLSNITSGARGSVISFITKGNLENFEFAAPSGLDNFNVIDVFSSINKTILNNKKENEKLSTLRDTLLPKLMSGKINVEKVEV